jgi:hypothetical protein
MNPQLIFLIVKKNQLQVHLGLSHSPHIPVQKNINIPLLLKDANEKYQ